MQTDFQLYKVDMKYIRNLHNIDDKGVLNFNMIGLCLKMWEENY